MKEVISNDVKTNQLFLVGMVVSMFLWGLSWASGKVLSHYGFPLQIAFFRFVVTFIALLLMLLLKKENLTVSRNGWHILAIAAVFMTLYNFLFFKGLSAGKAGAGGVLVTTLNPLIAYGLMLLISKRMPTKKESLGLSLGITAGLVLLKIWTSGDLILNSGNIYFLGAALCWSLLSLFTARSSKYGSPLTFSLWMFLICSVLTFVFVPMDSIVTIFIAGDFYFWGNLFFSGVITTAFATTFYFVATAKIGASKASSFIFLVPLSAALGSWAFLNEVPVLSTIIGGVLGIAAVFVLNKK